METRTKRIMFGAAVFSVAALGGVVYWLRQRSLPPPVYEPQKPASTAPAAIPAAEEPIRPATTTPAVQPMEVSERRRDIPKDADKDALNDEEEARYGTDPVKADTDGDGVVDGEEIFLFGTDPLRANALDEEGNPVMGAYRDGAQAVPRASPATSATPLGDRDGDGLTDEQERQLGTDAQKTDTDGDGVSDFEEADRYRTDPLKPDTDGDGYPDGNEIQNGYNPLGGGKCVRTDCSP